MLLTNLDFAIFADHDGAEPCGNSVAAHNLLLLGDYFADGAFHERARKLLDYFSNVAPFGYVLPKMMSAALMEEHGRDMLIVIGR